MSHYQAELQALLSKAASPGDRFKTVALMLTVKLSEMNETIEEIEKVNGFNVTTT